MKIQLQFSIPLCWRKPSMTRIIEVVPYDPVWSKDYLIEAIKLKTALGDNFVDIHHIGSTAVPGLAAKPVLDILPVVKNILGIQTEKLEDLGYTARGEMGMPFRRFFNKGEPQRTHHLHVWEQDSPEIQKHLLFRDYLRAHPEVAKEYAAMKIELAHKFNRDRANYIASKDDFIKR
jgi:GrpB-like predicted nucleotidyltransferase (UPF0157 family)